MGDALGANERSGEGESCRAGFVRQIPHAGDHAVVNAVVMRLESPEQDGGMAEIEHGIAGWRIGTVGHPNYGAGDQRILLFEGEFHRGDRIVGPVWAERKTLEKSRRPILTGDAQPGAVHLSSGQYIDLRCCRVQGVGGTLTKSGEGAIGVGERDAARVRAVCEVGEMI